ncbi:MAG: alpha/beta hydrolase [Prosthecobacter sp.]|nr:alpha/beta hydrolase [Prosthecobacter sp.]
MKILLLLSLAAATAAEPLPLPLWPEGAPGKMLPHSGATEAFLKSHQSKNTVTDITEPTIVVYRPAKPNGTSVIVAPGGAYIFLSAVHEGTQVCEWLNTLGVTGILLNYRTPTRDETAPHEKPVQDAQRALKLVREHAKEWDLNPRRVGLLGFSAGGNLLGHAACDRPTPKQEVPDFAIMIYGGGFLDPKDSTKLAPTFTVPADAPPMFLACAHDDGNNPIATTLLYLEYKKQNLSAELHLFTKGGHGFGMRKDGKPINEWPARCAEWMDSMGWLPTVSK